MSTLREEQRDEFSKKHLTTKLKEMGFDEGKDFIVVHDYDNWQISDGPSAKEANPYTSFGSSRDSSTGLNTIEGNDMQIQKTGKFIGVGSNNDFYSAQVLGEKEMIITKNPDIYHNLCKEYGLENSLSVPMSNGGYIMDDQKRFAFERMKNNCKFREESKELKKCTAAVQRGDIITAYEPQSEALGEFRNVFHYKKNSYGSFDRISSQEAAKYFGRYDISNSAQSIKSAEKNNDKVDLKGIKIDLMHVSKGRE